MSNIKFIFGPYSQYEANTRLTNVTILYWSLYCENHPGPSNLNYSLPLAPHTTETQLAYPGATNQCFLLQRHRDILKIEDNIKNEDDLKNKINLKMKTTSMRTNSKMKTI